jgi:hypothetical protein|eukprot:scaffold864_cov246-Chaetoceros_neogracile.AAC.4
MASQRPQGGGIIPTNILKSLDELVDRINCGAKPSKFPIVALLVGTNEGIPLSRSFGTIPNPQQESISEEVLSSIETIWATLPSATPPHVKNAMHMRRAGNANKDTALGESYKKGESKEPPHPLVSHLGLGDHVKTTMAFYDHVTLIHVHLAPIVVTILASPDPSTNIGSIKSIAVPCLHELLQPVKHALVSICYDVVNGQGGGIGHSIPEHASSGYY